jgi:hypothetical protein
VVAFKHPFHPPVCHARQHSQAHSRDHALTALFWWVAGFWRRSCAAAGVARRGSKAWACKHWCWCARAVMWWPGLCMRDCSDSLWHHSGTRTRLFEQAALRTCCGCRLVPSLACSDRHV